ncbi:uncharacterized protein EAF02_007741 [Botrytis sinoallii]|uniref:uncharacterized protein n=1 Tax=Botrytis sinoallii TaxID=1463999 RepID=UPI0018FFCBBA|nr:uncharacterized protein EAF02_007741 [Botrytis sinoallii]KAF7880104.1 hypothetical protein EAF02_007741 [Botrytis sinoallii]
MSSIKELSERIARNSAIVEKWLAGKNVKVSFDQDAEDGFPDTDGEPEIEAARMAVIDDTSALHDLFLGPREVLARIWGAALNNAAQQVIYHFNILPAIPLDGGATYAEISTKDPSQSQKHVITGYPWAELGEATVVDVGGSSGFLSVELAKKYPELNFVVEDYKKNVEQGAAQLSSELTNRVKFLQHNFFDPQPVTGAEVYVLRHICHDWSHENSVKIIRQIVPAMKPGSKILLVEIVVSPSNRSMSSIAERYLRYMLNAQERSESEWREIINEADSNLELTRILVSLSSQLHSVIGFKNINNRQY